MINQKQSNLKKSLFGVVLATLALLLIPFLSMQLTEEVAWSAGDFLIMGVLLFSVGLAFVLITRSSSNISYKVAIGLTLGITFLMIWANLAVGLMGAGPHAGNLMYLGVIAVVVIGTVLSRFSPSGLERTTYATSLSLVLLAAIALLAKMDQYPGSSLPEIIGVNGFFALLYLVAGALFRHSARHKV